MNMTQETIKKDKIEKINYEIGLLVKKRDHAADTLNNPWLAMSYQQDIDRLAASLKSYRE